MNGVLEDVSDKVSLSCFYVAWESYQYENILSLVVSCGWDADVNEYNVYLYDIVSGQQLTTAGLLKTLDVDETVFLEAVRRAAAAKFDTQYGAIAGGDTDEFLTERRDWTLSDENINMDVRTYADGDGKLHVVLPIGSVAGAVDILEVSHAPERTEVGIVQPRDIRAVGWPVINDENKRFCAFVAAYRIQRLVCRSGIFYKYHPCAGLAEGKLFHASEAALEARHGFQSVSQLNARRRHECSHACGVIDII